MGDARIASIQGRRKLEQPIFLCPFENKVDFLCLNPKCDAALSCSVKDCVPCFSKHENCGKIYPISHLTNKINHLAETRWKVIRVVEEIDKKFDSLDEKTSRLVDKIYQQEGGTNMSGMQADQLCAEVDEVVNGN